MSVALVGADFSRPQRSGPIGAVLHSCKSDKDWLEGTLRTPGSRPKPKGRRTSRCLASRAVQQLPCRVAGYAWLLELSRCWCCWKAASRRRKHSWRDHVTEGRAAHTQRRTHVGSFSFALLVLVSARTELDPPAWTPVSQSYIS